MFLTDVFVYVNSVFEIILFYSLLILLDYNNRIKIYKIVIIVVALTAFLSLINSIELPYYLVISFLIFSIVFCIAIYRNPLKTIPDILISIVLISVIEVFIQVIWHISGENSSKLGYFHILVILIFIIAINFLKRVKRIEKFLEKHYRKNRWIVVLVSTNIILILILLSHIWNNEKTIFINEQLGISIYLLLLIANNAILLILLTRVRIIRNRNIMHETYNAKLQDAVFEQRRAEHDFKGHLNTVLAIMKENTDVENKERVIDFIKEVQKEKRPSTITVMTENTVISSYLNYTKDKLREKDIKFNFYINKKTPKYRISEYELVEMLTNLVENAEEYLDTIHSGLIKKEILIMFQKEQIEFSNPVIGITDEDLIDFQIDGFSTKGSDRGYGLFNVEKIADKYELELRKEIRDSYIYFIFVFKN